MLKFTITPFPGDLSYNKMYRIGFTKAGHPRLFKTVLARNIQKEYQFKVGLLATQFDWVPKRKVWVRMFVCMPSHAWDAHNFDKGVCDIVKKAINIDDTWFSVIVDWKVDKMNPRIDVEVWQDDPDTA